MTKYLFFQWLHIEIGRVFDETNSESAKVGSKVYHAGRMLRTFSNMHMNHDD